MEKSNEEAGTGCCERFNPEPWNEKEQVWQDKLFLKDRVLSFFHIPLNFSKVMVKNMEKIKQAEALADEPLMLSDENSLFGSDLYIATSQKVPGAEMVRLSGTYLTKVFEGPYQDAGKWMQEMKEFVGTKGKQAKKYYLFYTTCPSCAKVYGKNYTVILAQIK